MAEIEAGKMSYEEALESELRIPTTLPEFRG